MVEVFDRLNDFFKRVGDENFLNFFKCPPYQSLRDFNIRPAIFGEARKVSEVVSWTIARMLRVETLSQFQYLDTIRSGSTLTEYPSVLINP